MSTKLIQEESRRRRLYDLKRSRAYYARRLRMVQAEEDSDSIELYQGYLSDLDAEIKGLQDGQK